ncbi:MAG: hypothetical protein KAH30_05350 [Caldisericia bacterium]|nr:hypothetical protein [Caldisericia bacterium]
MKRIDLCDVTLRDGQQSLLATRMTSDQAFSVLPDILDAGFSELELWGGATIDAPLRFLGENPWDRLDRFKKMCLGRAKIRALIRGQNLFAYSPFADNLVVAFCKAAIESGVGVMRMFDALNDRRNLMISLLASKAFGATAEVCFSYTTSPVHSSEGFASLAIDLAGMGADIITIKDMAGLLTPENAHNLVTKIKSSIDVPLTLHGHCTCGYSTTNAVVTMLAGIDRIDTSIGPFAGGTAQPPVTLVATFADRLGFEHGIDLSAVYKASKKLYEIRKTLSKFDKWKDSIPEPIPYPLPPSITDKIDVISAHLKKHEFTEGRDKMVELMSSLGYPAPDATQLKSQVPGGMLSNLRTQLATIGRLDNLPKILEEVQQVRKDAGYPPLVTPTSQIVGAQASFNIETAERYQVCSREFKDMICGRYGRSGKIDEAFVTRVAKTTNRYDQRSGFYVKASPLTEDDGLNPPAYIHNHRDLLLYLMLPGPAKDFFSNPEADDSGNGKIH